MKERILRNPLNFNLLTQKDNNLSEKYHFALDVEIYCFMYLNEHKNLNLSYNLN